MMLQHASRAPAAPRPSTPTAAPAHRHQVALGAWRIGARRSAGAAAAVSQSPSPGPSSAPGGALAQPTAASRSGRRSSRGKSASTSRPWPGGGLDSADAATQLAQLNTVSASSVDLSAAAALRLANTDAMALLGTSPQPQAGPTVLVTRPLPRVLILHTGGTLGMEQGPDDTSSGNGASPEADGGAGAAAGKTSLRPAAMLQNVLSVVPELRRLSNVDLQVAFNKDSSRVGPEDWIALAKMLHARRQEYDAFLVIHGTDTMSFTAAALSYMLRNFGKPIVLTGSQLPLAAPRTDARQNLLDAIQCATASFSPPHINLQEVAICFGGRLMRGNRCRKVNTSSYQAFDSFGYPHLAQLGIDVAWNKPALLKCEGAYVPRFKLDPAVVRVPVSPGVDPRQAYGDLVGRGVKGAVLEVFGVGNMPDLPQFGWVPWLEQQIAAGLKLAVVSQCGAGPLHPELYAAGGALAAALTKASSSSGLMSVIGGGPGGSSMTPEAALTKLMFILAYPDLTIGEALAGEL